MPVGPLRPGIREQLTWLEPSKSQFLELNQLHLKLIFTWGKGLSEEKAVEAVYALHEIGPHAVELKLETFFSREDLESIAAGEHSYYNFDGDPTERLGQFMDELFRKEVAPAVLYDFWSSLLRETGGNEFQALVEVTFRRPLEEL